MRLLIIAGEFPVPQTTATRIKVHNLLRGLAARHQLHLVAFADGNEWPSREQISYVQKLGCRDVRIYPKIKASGFRDAVQSLLELSPHAYRHYRAPQLLDDLRRLCDREAFDVIHCDLNMTEIGVSLVDHAATVLSPNDSITKSKVREVLSAPDIRAKTLAISQVPKFVYAESVMYRRFSAVHVVSEPEAAWLRRLSTARVHVVPIGVDVPEHMPCEPRPSVHRSVVISGNLSSPFTTDGILWFLDKVWPLLQRMQTQCQLRIVGRRPNAKLVGAAKRSTNVTIEADVPDMPAALRQSLVYLCPLTYGGGIKTRLLEAMACGLPIVTTSVGAEGIRCLDGQHWLVADSPAAFARAAATLLADADQRAKLSRAAFEVVSTAYSWKSFVDGMETIYRSVCTPSRDG